MMTRGRESLLMSFPPKYRIARSCACSRMLANSGRIQKSFNLAPGTRTTSSSTKGISGNELGTFEWPVTMALTPKGRGGYDFLPPTAGHIFRGGQGG